MSRPKGTDPNEPLPWADYPGGSLEWFAQGMYEAMRKRSAARKKLRAEIATPPTARPESVPVPGPVPENEVWRADGHVRTRDFWNRNARDPVGAMLVDDLGGVTVEIMPCHLDEDGVRALEEFVSRLLLATR